MHAPSSRRYGRLTLCLAIVLAMAPRESSAGQREDVGDALLTLTAALAGEGGGTRAQIGGALDDLGRALSLWDARLAALETRLRAGIADASPRDAAQIRTTLGALLFERGRLADALEEFSTANQQDPALPTAWLTRALVLDALGERDAAREALATALRAAPNEATTGYLLSRATPSGDELVLLPTTRALLTAAQRLRTTADGPRTPFVDVSIIDDRAPARYRFLPAGYGSVVMPLVASRQYDAAYAALRTLIGRDPLLDDPALSSAEFADAALEIDAGRPEAALMRLAAMDDPLRRSSELHRLRAAAYRAAAQPERARAELETARQIAPGNERAAVALLNLLAEEGDLMAAERIAGEMQATLGESAAVAWLQAQIYSAMGREKDVVTSLRRALRARPLTGSGPIWSTLGLFRTRSFEPDASDAFDQDVRLNLNRPEPHLLLGESLRVNGRINEAFAEFAAAVLIQPDSLRAHLSIGQMHLDAGRYAEAIASLRWVAARSPSLAGARYALANALQRAGQPDEAAEEFAAFTRLQAQATEADRKDRRVGALQLQAALFEQTGQCVQAADVRRRLIQLTPEMAVHHVALADCLVRLGQHEEAAEALERAGSLGAPPIIFRRLADLYSKLDRPEDSAEATRRYEARQQPQHLLRTTMRSPFAQAPGDTSTAVEAPVAK
jgi:tetratricopeptide (TPR) repeat protein